LLTALRLSDQLKGMINEDNIPLADLAPLPIYAAEDLRAGELHAVMERFLLTLRIVDGLRGALASDKSPRTDQHILFQWGSARLGAYRDAVTRLVLPRAVTVAWKEKREILADLSRYLSHCIYDSEAVLSVEAAQYAAERSAGVILFLAICPNIPFGLPTLEIRLFFTKPLVAIATAIRAVFGNFFLIGFFLYVLEVFARLFDAIPKVQVRAVQRIAMRRWLLDERKRLGLIRRYVKAVDARIAKPRADAIVRGLLSIVS
jgi:hypothetical protein